jgi:VWFA-related protein
MRSMSRSFCRLLAAALLLALASLGALAQAPKQAAQAQTPTAAPPADSKQSSQAPETAFQSQSKLVLVPVSVLDKQEKPVAGLGKGDFQILVDGRPVPIESLDSSSVSGQSSAIVSQPGVFTNLAGSGRSGALILLVDLLNTSLRDRMPLRKQLISFIANDLPEREPVAIYALVNSLQLVEPFSTDNSRLIAAARRFNFKQNVPGKGGAAAVTFSPSVAAIAPPIVPGNPGGLATTSSPGINGADTAGYNVGADAGLEVFQLQTVWTEYNDNAQYRALTTLEAFRQIAGAFAGSAGEKTLVWMTDDASPLNPTLMNQIVMDNARMESYRVPTQYVVSTYHALAASSISVVPLDIQGSQNTGLVSASEQMSNAEFAQTAGEAPDSGQYSSPLGLRQSEGGNAVLAMQGVAAETGGVVLRGSNNIRGQLEKAQKLWGQYYILSFQPPAETKLNEVAYHRIEVKLTNREPHIFYRRGYTTLPESIIASDQVAQRDFGEALHSPMDLTAVPLQGIFQSTMVEQKTARMTYQLSIPIGSLGWLPVGDKRQYDVTVVSAVHDEHGKLVSGTQNKFKPAISAGQIRTFNFIGKFTAPVGETYFGRAIVRDNITGHMGTVTIELPWGEPRNPA